MAEWVRVPSFGSGGAVQSGSNLVQTSTHNLKIPNLLIDMRKQTEMDEELRKTV